jgi:cyclohexa-1,5-dienecarbonyl-CoA hydratase
MASTTTARFSRIALNAEEGTARLTLSHPPLNVIDVAMMEELSQALADINARGDISVIVLAGSSKTFSVGVDVAAHTPDKVEQMLTKFHAVIRTLVSSSKVTVACVRGHCLGGGAELAMVCDMVFTAESATWGFPEIKLGCFPPVATTALSALVGQKRATDLILTGRTISGREAAGIGLANSSLPDEQLEATVEETVARLRQLSPAALAVTKKAFYAWDAMHFDKGLARAEKIYFDELMKTEDAREGIQSFLEKRQPEWKGK